MAFSYGISFAPLSWIDQLYDVRPSIGDTLYDTNDKGMEMIARAIYNYVY